MTIRRIEYACSRPIDRSHLDPFLGLKPGDVLTRTGVKNAIQALYDTGRFNRIVVDAEPLEQGVLLRFVLELNLYFNRFIITGNYSLRGQVPSEVLPLPVGQRFTETKLAGARRGVLDYLRERGFQQARVEATTQVDEVERQVDTTFTVETGPRAKVRSVTVEGVPQSELEAVRRSFSVKPGQDYSRGRINRATDDLRAYLVKRGFLAAVPKVTELFDASNDMVSLTLRISGFGRVRVVVEGYKIPRDRLSRLLPVLLGEGLQPELLEEGSRNLREYLEEQGYPEAEVTIQDERSAEGEGVVRYRVEPGDKVTVNEVSFRGNRAFTDAQLEAVMQIKPARFLQKSSYSIAKLDSDLRALQTLYRSAGYLDAVVIPLIESEEGGGRLRITFECTDGPLARVRALSFSGNHALTSEELKAKLTLKPGGPYSPQIVEQNRLALLNVYNNTGYLQARASQSVTGPEEGNSYTVRYEIEEGGQSLINNVLILGYERTRRPLIEKHVDLRPNEPLSTSKLIQTEQELYNLGIFDLVRVGPQNPESAAGYQNVVVRVTEGQQYVLRYGIGYQEREKVRGLFEISDLNFLGNGRRSDLRFRVSSVEQAAIWSFQQARVSFLPVNSYFAASYAREKEISFDSQKAGVSYQYSHPASRHSWLIGRVNFRNVQVSNYQGSLADIAREDQPRNLTTFSAIYVNDTRDNYFDPEKGFFTSTDVGVTPFSGSQYLSFYSQNSYHRRLLPFLGFSAALRAGYMWPFNVQDGVPDYYAVPISERFFAGGPTSLRGFRTDEAGPLNPQSGKPDGGNALIISTLEFYLPLYRIVSLAGFYDGGNVFRNFHQISASEYSHTIGVGLRIKTPIGPLRFDYGFNLNLSDDRRALGYPSRLFFFSFGNPF